VSLASRFAFFAWVIVALCVTLTPAERTLRAQIGAHDSWAKTENRSARTAKARQAFQDRFLTEAGGDPKRAEHLRKAFYARMSLKSAQARRRRGGDGSLDG
jgi:hypothetical protein